MQKSFTENFLTGKRKKNNGELDMYFIKNNHEARMPWRVAQHRNPLKYLTSLRRNYGRWRSFWYGG